MCLPRRAVITLRAPGATLGGRAPLRGPGVVPVGIETTIVSGLGLDCGSCRNTEPIQFLLRDPGRVVTSLGQPRPLLDIHDTLSYQADTLSYQADTLSYQADSLS